MRYLLIPVFVLVVIFSCKGKKEHEDTAEVSAADKLVNELVLRAEKYPDSLQLRLNLVNALDSLRRYRDALSHMQVILKKDSNNNSVWARNAQLLERNGDTASAIESYLKSLSIYPDPNNQLYLANLLAERKDPRALLVVNTVSKTQFDDETLAHCDFIAGVYHARTGNMQMAERLFNRCITHDRKYMVAYLEKGFLYFDRKRYRQALRIFQVAADVEPTYADAFYWQGKTYEAMGKPQEAINVYRQAINLDPGLKEASAAITRLAGQAI
ncbi:MAG TPA: tetratricopeptide repeat protein [Chitinophagaceae bacterium]